MESENKKLISIGPLLALLSGIVFSFGGVIIKFMPWNAISINSARSIIACVLTYIFIRVRRHKIKVNAGVIVGAAAYAGMSLTFCLSTKLTTSANAILLQYTSPLFLIFILWAVYKQKPKLRDIVMCIAVFAGIIFFFFDALSAGNMLGNAVALCSGLLYSIMFVCNTVAGGDAISSFFIGQIISVFIGIPFLMRETVFTPIVLLGAVALGLIVGGGYILLSVALKTTPPVAANLIGALEPVLNPTWVAIFYGEKMSALAIIGFVIVLVSVVIYNLKPIRRT